MGDAVRALKWYGHLQEDASVATQLLSQLMAGCLIAQELRCLDPAAGDGLPLSYSGASHVRCRWNCCPSCEDTAKLGAQLFVHSCKVSRPGKDLCNWGPTKVLRMNNNKPTFNTHTQPSVFIQFKLLSWDALDTVSTQLGRNGFQMEYPERCPMAHPLNLADNLSTNSLE